MAFSRLAPHRELGIRITKPPETKFGVTHDLPRSIPELANLMAGYSLELDLQTRGSAHSPFTPNCIAHHGVKVVPPSVRRKACVVEAGRSLRLPSNHLHLGVGERRHIMSKRSTPASLARAW